MNTIDMEKKVLTMVFGNKNTKYKGFDEYDMLDTKYLSHNDFKVKLTEIGFAHEWQELVDYDKSYAYIDRDKLYVVVHGLPEYISREAVEKHYKKTINQYLVEEDGEFFETNPGCPIGVNVEHRGNEITI